MSDDKPVTTKDLNKLTAAMNRGFSRMQDRFNGLDGKFNGLDGKFNGLDGKFNGLDGKFNGLNEKFNGLRDQLSNQNMVLKEIRTDLGQVKHSVRRLGILYEDLDDRFTTLTEAVTDNLKVRGKVNDHEDRLQNVETGQKLLKKTVRIHSRQLNKKPA